MKIKMLKDEIVATSLGPVRLFAGSELGPTDGITPEIGASLIGRGFAKEIKPPKPKKATKPRRRAASKKNPAPALEKAIIEEEIAEAEASDVEIKG